LSAVTAAQIDCNNLLGAVERRKNEATPLYASKILIQAGKLDKIADVEQRGRFADLKAYSLSNQTSNVESNNIEVSCFPHCIAAIARIITLRQHGVSFDPTPQNCNPSEGLKPYEG
jgi:hypothetical protein